MRLKSQGLDPGFVVAMDYLPGHLFPSGVWEPGDDWRDDQCESVIDGADRVANVCRGVYGRGEVFLGIYWNDGAEVVGPCNATDSWPMEYRGLSRADAYDWLVAYCGW